MKNKKKKHIEIEHITEEEAFGFYMIAGYTENGMPYGISMEEAEEEGLLDNTDDQLAEDNDLPF